MNEITFALMVLVFVLGLFGRNLWSCVSGTLRGGIKRRRQGAANGVCDDRKKALKDDNNFRVLNKMEYFSASNDEKNTRVYSPTPFQDVDPKNLA
ncbi:MAG: hypothetical protein LBO02_00975 [Holosporaceae bacterium]|nr:hypothetical protein [Holosporaceae bacterium]